MHFVSNFKLRGRINYVHLVTFWKQFALYSFLSGLASYLVDIWQIFRTNIEPVGKDFRSLFSCFHRFCCSRFLLLSFNLCVYSLSSVFELVDPMCTVEYFGLTNCFIKPAGCDRIFCPSCFGLVCPPNR